MITGDPNGFNVSVLLTAITGETATVYAPGNNIGRKMDSGMGIVVNVKNSNVVVHENNILAANPDYPVRNDDGEVSMIGHLVSYVDNSGVTFDYIVQENIPDQTVGLITLLLGDYDGSN